MTLTPPEGYEPLSDAALADIRESGLPMMKGVAKDLVLTALYWRARALAAERRIATRCEWCAGDKDIDQPCKNGCDGENERW